MENLKLKITVQEICYYLFFSLLFFAKGAGLYDGQNIFKICLILGGICLAAKLLFTEYKVKELVIIAVLCLVSMLSYYQTREKGILFSLMMVIGLKNIPLKRLFKVALFVWSISFIPMVIMTTLGLVSSPFRVHVRPLVGFVIRWGLGSAHPNVGHMSYLILVILIVYILDKKVSWKSCALLFMGNCFVFLYTVSQTGFIMTTFYLMVIMYLSYRKQPSKWEYGMVECVLPGCILASLVLPILLTGKAFDILNKLMNTRVMQSKRYLTEERITLFGSRLGLNDAVNTMDNSYLFAFMTYGVITFIILMAAYFFVIRRYIKERKNKELAIIVTLLIAGLSEPFLFNTSFKNLSLLFWGGLIFTPMKQNSSLWGRTVCILKGGDREMEIALEKAVNVCSNIKKCISDYKKVLVIGAVIFALLWPGSYMITAVKHTEIIVPRNLCDSTDLPSVYVEDGIAAGGGLILGYKDKETPMVAFEGTLPSVEYIRGIICRAAYGGMLGFIVVLGERYMIKYRDSRK
ncbi:hypothetical protein [Kineothrix sp. MB12-C1]|uniref:hypothetical protein n=1 Tax=Kineothrix sp. MB12-C1 TaxID=3070215 RepID=UPI0027D29EE7|nr:hypothetical protein [Kineothrix sp. MB12-C1]WMC91683.1 hypothetical protein RBB56_12510 [Kineothrix sp. MB12-C1]